MSGGKVLGLIFSPNVQRALLTAYELDLPVTNVPVDLRVGAHKTPEFLAKNPFGEIPVYEGENGTTIFESRAIARYLDAKAGSVFSKIADPAIYAQVEQWAGVEQSQFNPAAGALVYELFFKKLRGLETDAAAAEKHKEKLNTVLAIYEKHLGNHHYFAGNEYTLADIFHVPLASTQLRRIFYPNFTSFRNALKVVYPEALATHPNIKAWLEKVGSRPAVQKLAKEVAEARAAFEKK